MTYSSLPEIYRSVLLIFATVILIVLIYAIVQIVGLAGRKHYLLSMVAMFLLTFVLYQGMIMYQEGDIGSFDVSLAVMIPLLLGLFTAALLAHAGIRCWRKENISAMSVKEAVDRLPAGILCYTGDKIPIIVNESMDAISRRLTGRSLTDVEVLREELVKRSGKESVSEHDPLIINEGEKAYSFQRSTVQVNGI